MYPGMIDGLKKYVVKNNALPSYLRGLLNKVHYPLFVLDSKLPSEEEGKRRIDQEILNFPILAQGFDAKSIYQCIFFALENLELVKSLEKFLTKDDVESNRNTNTVSFFAEILPTLCEASPRWLKLYSQEILNLINPLSSNKQGINKKLAGMIADFIQTFNPKDRTYYYSILIQGNTFMNHMHVLLSCKNKAMQEEMTAYLVQKNRWDMLWSAAWRHKDSLNVSRIKERDEGIELLRQKFTPEIIRRDWGNTLAWDRQMPCVIMRDQRLKETAYNMMQTIEEIRVMFRHIFGCMEITADEKLDFVSHLGDLQDGILEKYFESETSYYISSFINLIKKDALWKRFIPFLQDLPKKDAELPEYVSKNIYGVNQEQIKIIMADLGWKLPDEED
jgi:hypothetical protein